MLKFKQLSEAMWQSSAGEIIFGDFQAEFSNRSSSWLFPLFPVTEKVKTVLSRRSGIAYHVTDLYGLERLIGLQNDRNKHISASTVIEELITYKGVWNAGVGALVRGDMHFEQSNDSQSIPDQSGKRWIALSGQTTDMGDDPKIRSLVQSSRRSLIQRFYPAFVKDGVRFLRSVPESELEGAKEKIEYLYKFQYKYATSPTVDGFIDSMRKNGRVDPLYLSGLMYMVLKTIPKSKQLIQKYIEIYITAMEGIILSNKETISQAYMKDAIASETSDSMNEVIISNFEIIECGIIVDEEFMGKLDNPELEYAKIKNLLRSKRIPYRELLDDTDVNDFENVVQRIIRNQ